MNTHIFLDVEAFGPPRDWQAVIPLHLQDLDDATDTILDADWPRERKTKHMTVTEMVLGPDRIAAVKARLQELDDAVNAAMDKRTEARRALLTAESCLGDAENDVECAERRLKSWREQMAKWGLD